MAMVSSTKNKSSTTALTIGKYHVVKDMPINQKVYFTLFDNKDYVEAKTKDPSLAASSVTGNLFLCVCCWSSWSRVKSGYTFLNSYCDDPWETCMIQDVDVDVLNHALFPWIITFYLAVLISFD